MKKNVLALVSSILLLAGCTESPTDPEEPVNPDNPCTHVDVDHNGKCDSCGEEVTVTHIDENHDHKCDVCDFVMSTCADTNNDHKCDLCGTVLSTCADLNNDHNCDVCGEKLSDHCDQDKNHYCDICQEKISDHQDLNKDHYCDCCEDKISECVDADVNNHCDICGKVIDYDKEPVTKEVFTEALSALSGNFSANAKTDLYYTIENVDLVLESKTYLESNPKVQFEDVEYREAKISYDTVKHHDDIVIGIGREPSLEDLYQIAAYKFSEYVNTDYALGVHKIFTLEDIKYDETSGVFYMEELTSDPGAYADLAPAPQNIYFDYDRLYQINTDDIVETSMYLTKSRMNVEFDDFDEENEKDLLDVLINLPNYFELADYDQVNKTFTFDNEDFFKMFNHQICDFSMIGDCGFHVPGYELTEGEIVVDFSRENVLESITINGVDSKNSTSTFKIDNFEYDIENIKVPEIPAIECEHGEQDYYSGTNHIGHYSYCEKCDIIFDTHPHKYDANGVCEECGFFRTSYTTLDGEDLPYRSETDLCLEINTVTREIVDVALPYDAYSSFEPNEVADFTGCELKSDDVRAPINYEDLDVFYVLDYTSIDSVEGCIINYNDYNAVYRVENGKATLYKGPYNFPWKEEEHGENIKIDMNSLVKTGVGQFECDAHCDACGKTYHGTAVASFYSYTSSAEDMSNVNLWFTYTNDCGEFEHIYSPDFPPQYDVNGYDYYTGKHRPVEKIYYESYLLGAVYYQDGIFAPLTHFTSLAPYSYLGKEGEWSCCKFDDTGADEIIIKEREYVTKDEGTCIQKEHYEQIIYVNGIEYASYINEFYKDYNEQFFDHDFEIVKGSLHYYEPLQMYLVDIVCKDCGKVFTLLDVKIKYNLDCETHTLTGVYYTENEFASEPYQMKITLTEDCTEDPSNPGFCLYCGQDLIQE